jgi:enamine deaminase RidA (YjgF/YER057c/UK114 family)
MILTMSEKDKPEVDQLEPIREAIDLAIRQVVAIVDTAGLSEMQIAAVRSVLTGLCEAVIMTSYSCISEQMNQAVSNVSTGTGTVHEQGDELFWRPNPNPESKP